MSKVDLLKRINKSLSPYKVDFSSIDTELNVLKKKMEETVNIQTVADVKYELDKFKKKLNLSSISDEIKKVESSLSTQYTDLKNQVERKSREVDLIKSSIASLQKSDKLTALETEISALQKALKTKEGDIQTFGESLKQVSSFEQTITQSLQGLTENINSRFTKTEAKKAIQDILDRIEENKGELLSRIGHLGGGSKPLRILNNGTDLSKRYADVNLKGSGVTISAVDNHTTRQVDVTLTASGGSLTILTATGTIDDSNAVFTFTSTPRLLVINGAMYQSSGGAYTWTGTTTTTLNNPVGTGGSIFGLT